MRLDRVNLAPLEGVLRAMVEEALTQPGRVVREKIPTSPKDRVQVFVKGEEGRVILAIRRPQGDEDPRELQALAQHMGLVILAGPERRYGKTPRPQGPRAYLVAVCDLDPSIWEGMSMDEVLAELSPESHGSPSQGPGLESDENPEQEGVTSPVSSEASPDTPLLEEVQAWLKALGYRAHDWSRSEGVENYGFVLETDTIHLAPYLPVERIHRGLSELERTYVTGQYVASMRVENGVVTWIGHTFYYTIRAESGGVRAEVRLSGRMDAPFPQGRPTEHTVSARLFVGPVAMGKGQKARAKQAVAEALASLPAFVEAFPEAKVIAVLETRGGRGGWKAKVAWHHLGHAAEWGRKHDQPTALD